MKKNPEEIGELIRLKLTEEFKFFEILAVNVRRDTDFDGDPILRIRVVYDGEEKNIDSSALAGTTRRVRPILYENEEDAFPIFSFISKQDADIKHEPVRFR